MAGDDMTREELANAAREAIDAAERAEATPVLAGRLCAEAARYARELVDRDENTSLQGGAIRTLSAALEGSGDLMSARERFAMWREMVKPPYFPTEIVILALVDGAELLVRLKESK